MNYLKTKILILSLPTFFIFSSFSEKINEAYNLSKSASLFHISLVWNRFRYGNEFNFNQITQNNNQTNEIKIEFDNNNNILLIMDDKKSPIILGSIPRTPENINTLKKTYNLNETDIIGIYTLNREFEINWAGLADLFQQKINLKHYKYPTTDYTAPAFIDLLRAVRDLETRDNTGQKIAYIHCKAGRGRSVTTVLAYLFHIFNKCEIDITFEKLYNFLKLIRPQVDLNKEQIKTAINFNTKLKEAGNLQNLLKLNKNELEKRDKEVITAQIKSKL